MATPKKRYQIEVPQMFKKMLADHSEDSGLNIKTIVTKALDMYFDELAKEGKVYEDKRHTNK